MLVVPEAFLVFGLVSTAASVCVLSDSAASSICTSRPLSTVRSSARFRAPCRSGDLTLATVRRVVRTLRLTLLVSSADACTKRRERVGW